VEDRIESLKHDDGYVERIIFQNGKSAAVKAIYVRPGFKQHSNLANILGCEMTNDGYIAVDSGLRTTIPGVYACGDNVTRMRTIANAISMGTTTAITLNKDLIHQSF
jgi:thioredoxin reductase